MDCKAFRQEIEELETGEPLGAGAQAHVNSCVACRTFQSERLSLRAAHRGSVRYTHRHAGTVRGIHQSGRREVGESRKGVGCQSKLIAHECNRMSLRVTV